MLQLEKHRSHDSEWLDKKVVYTTVVITAAQMITYTPPRYTYRFGLLSRALSECGPAYHLYATIIDEQTLYPGAPVIFYSSCDICPMTLDGWMRGTQYKCLKFMDTDLYADC